MAQPECPDPCDLGFFESSNKWILQCGGTQPGCFWAHFYSPDLSAEREFHPPELRKATEQINDIFRQLERENNRRRSLKLLRIPGGGMMLAWSDRDAKRPDKDVL